MCDDNKLEIRKSVSDTKIINDKNRKGGKEQRAAELIGQEMHSACVPMLIKPIHYIQVKFEMVSGDQNQVQLFFFFLSH